MMACLGYSHGETDCLFSTVVFLMSFDLAEARFDRNISVSIPVIPIMLYIKKKLKTRGIKRAYP